MSLVVTAAGQQDAQLNLPDIIYPASTWIVPVLIAITFHEAPHAYAAWKLGDDTAFHLGRVTFNPLKHVDPFGTILLPALLFLTDAPFPRDKNGYSVFSVHRLGWPPGDSVRSHLERNHGAHLASLRGAYGAARISKPAVIPHSDPLPKPAPWR
jgi:hypothetical protein